MAAAFRLAGPVTEADTGLPAKWAARGRLLRGAGGGSLVEQELVARLVAAFEAADVDGIVALMTQDAWLRMPPVPLEYQGRELAGQFFATVAFRQGRRYRLVPTRANGQPAFAVYLRDPVNQAARAFGLLVVTLTGDRISAITRFDNTSLSQFGLPRTLGD